MNTLATKWERGRGRRNLQKQEAKSYIEFSLSDMQQQGIMPAKDKNPESLVKTAKYGTVE